MKEAVRQISEKYRLALSDDEIQRIAEQAADANAYFEQLLIDGIDGLMPLPIVSRNQVKR
jgi:Asp-tRNA(Asn)/Glu-tRNA(Gln) amidotransferase C subunit